MSAYRRIRLFLSYYLGGLYRRVDQHHYFLLAGGLAFSIFVCIVPLVFVVFAVLGHILETTAVERQIGLVIHRAIPYQDEAGFIEGIVLERTAELVTYRGAFGLVGIVGLLFAASGLFSSIRTILNLLFDVQRHHIEPIAKLRDFGMLLLVMLALVLSIAAMPVIEAVESWTETTILWRFSSPLVGMGILWTVFFLTYHLVPYGRMPWKTSALSALWAALLWLLAQHLFGLYLEHFATLERVYGAYLVLVAPVFWLYYSSLVFVVAAEIGQLSRLRQA